MKSNILSSRHVIITLAEKEPVDILAQKLLQVCNDAMIKPGDPLDDYLAVHAEASRHIDTGAEAFLASKQKQVEKWRPGKQACGKVLGIEVVLIITASWISIVFDKELLESEAISVADRLLEIVDGSAVPQIHPYPTLEVLEENLKMKRSRRENGGETGT